MMNFSHLLQLDHRILATATLAAIGGLWLSARKLDMHPAVRHLIGSTMGMAALQVLLFMHHQKSSANDFF